MSDEVKEVAESKAKPTILAAMWVLAQAVFWTTASVLEDFKRYILTYPKHFALLILVAVAFNTVFTTGNNLNDLYTLDKSSDITYDNIMKISRMSRPFLATDGIRSIQLAGAPIWMKREAVRSILFHARREHLSLEDQAILLTIADIESGFNPMAHSNTTTACGLFQFLTPTGGEYGLSVKNCMDPWENSRAQMRHYVHNYYEKIEKQVQNLSGEERMVKIFELSYYYHHDGLYSPKQSDTVKSIIPESSAFLMRAYQILKEESSLQVETTTFTQKFLNDLFALPDAVRAWYFDSRLYRHLLTTSTPTQSA